MKLLASYSTLPPHNSDFRSLHPCHMHKNYALNQNLQTINGLWQLKSQKSRPTPFLKDFQMNYTDSHYKKTITEFSK